MQEFIQQHVEPHFNFWVYVILMMIGLWALIAKNNLIKKLIGLSIFQTAIILFYISLSVKHDATIPILDHHSPDHASHDMAHGSQDQKHYEADDHAHSEAETHSAEKSGKPSHKVSAPDPDTMANPLPHVLMLTAIVVGVATLGVALAICQNLFREFDSLEEDEILDQIKGGGVHD